MGEGGDGRMYLFSRQARLAPGNTRKGMAFAAGVTEKVNQITALNVSLYAQVFSPEVGTLAWTAVVPDLETLEAASDKLLADDGYISMIDDAADLMMGAPDDVLGQILYGQPDPNRQIEYATTVQAECVPGRFERGIELGIEIAQRVEKITGTPMLFGSTMTGQYGGVSWISVHPNIRSVEADEAALAADTSFVKFLDKETGSVYGGGALPRQLLFRRIA
jgi:hypothetical protein